MLVLKRRCGEEIILGDTGDIRIKILSQKNGSISVGIAAPLSLRVDRREVFEDRRKQEEIQNHIINN